MIKPLLYSLCLISLSSTAHAQEVKPSPDHIAYPSNINNWRVIGTSLRTDNNTQRVILGNSLAIKAARKNTEQPTWPEGAILAKLVWKNTTLATWPAATVPGELMHAEIMVRNSEKYASTGGWGFARWIWTGLELKPFGDQKTANETCYSCHKAAQANDYVFTQPAKLP